MARRRNSSALAAACLLAAIGVLAFAGPAQATSTPVISGVTPGHGAPAGGTEVTITGSNFTGATEVKFGLNNAESFNVESDTEITAVAPAGTGTVDVTIESVVGTSPLVPGDQFSYSETQAEKEAWFTKFAEENARKVAEEAAIRMRHEEEATAAAARKRQEEEAAASHQREEEAAPRKKAAEPPDTGSVSLDSSTIAVQSSDMALVKLNCLGIASCRGKLTLTAKSTVEAKGKKKTRTVTIGTVSFSVVGDETKTVKLNLNAAGRALLKADHGRCAAHLTILELAPGAANTQTKTVRLVREKAVVKGRGSS